MKNYKYTITKMASSLLERDDSVEWFELYEDVPAVMIKYNNISTVHVCKIVDYLLSRTNLTRDDLNALYKLERI